MSQPPDPFQPLQPRRASERVAEVIRQRILDGVFQPGELLPPERTLAKRFAVTRNTVREGLRRLEQLRLVRIRQGSGVTVQDYLSHAGIEFLSALLADENAPPPAVVEHLLEARAVLGEAMLVHAVEHAERSKLDDFAKAVAALQQEVEAPSGEPRAFLDLDFDVHRALVRAGGNQAFALFLNSLRSIYEPVAHLFAAVVEDPAQLVAAYRRALAALEADDRAAAANELRNVFRAGRPAALKARGAWR